MMKKERFRLGRSLRLLALPALAILQLPACGLTTSNDDKTQDPLIAGFGANGSKLNAVGSLAIGFDGSIEPYCSASLIAPQVVLTAKHCLDLFYYGYPIYFTVGPDAWAPLRYVPAVEIVAAPGDAGGFVGYGHDVGIVHLGEPVTDLVPLEIGALSDADIGKKFIQIGYGASDNSRTYGARRTGKGELVAREGKIFEILFGSFERFVRWYETGSPGPDSLAVVRLPPSVEAELKLLKPQSEAAPVKSALPGASPPSPSAPGAGGAPPVDDSADAGAAGSDDGGVEDYLREIYDTTILDSGYEAVFGGKPGDAQACYGDSGSPIILGGAGGKFTAYGVVSGGVGSRELICNYGGVDATFGPEVQAFLAQEVNWVDPCESLSIEGVCEGDVAKRCTGPLEGKRRPIEFDCSWLGQVCATQADGTAGCSDP